MTKALSATKVRQAATELTAMRQSLQGWLKYRTMNDAIRSGQIPAVTGVVPQRNWRVEQDLATKLHTLLEEVLPDASLPSPNLQQNRAAAVQLAQIALTGQAPGAGPSAVGAAHLSLWPVLIVGGLLLAVTSAIRSAADAARSSEEQACIAAGACSDNSYWLRLAAIAAAVWFAWKELGLGAKVKHYMARRS